MADVKERLDAFDYVSIFLFFCIIIFVLHFLFVTDNTEDVKVMDNGDICHGYFEEERYVKSNGLTTVYTDEYYIDCESGREYVNAHGAKDLKIHNKMELPNAEIMNNKMELPNVETMNNKMGL